ncbi:MAG: NAD(P)/FAD-dependent oxidoreductase [Acidilobaceae archaeon]
MGAGIIGLSTAYHIKKMSPNSSILVVDRASAPGGGDSGKSAAAFRAFFTNRVNLTLANSSIEFYRSVQEGGFDLGLKFIGYLWLADKHLYESVKEGLREAEMLGLEFKILDPTVVEEGLKARVNVKDMEEAQLVGVGDIEAGILVPKAGIMDAEKLVDYYYRACSTIGVEFALDSEVESLIVEPRRPIGIEGEPFPWQDAKISGVRLRSGEHVRASKKVIMATGSWTWSIVSKHGVESFTRPKKRQVFSVKASREPLKSTLYAKGFNTYGISPFIILPRKAYMRPVPSEESYWVGVSDELGRPFELEDLEPRAEPEFYVRGVLPILSIYFPAFQQLYPHAMWAGYYDYSPDGLPIIYEPYESDLIISCGTSGSGIMKGDAIGRITAALALGFEEVELYTGETLKVESLGLKNRVSGSEKLVI